MADDGRARAIEAARRALALDNTLAEAHTSLAYGLVGEWAWEDAERHFRRAIDLNPRVPDGPDPLLGALAVLEPGQTDSAWAHPLDHPHLPPRARSERQRHRATGTGPVAAMSTVLRERPRLSVDPAGASGESGPPEAVLGLLELSERISEGHVDTALDLVEELVATGRIGGFVVHLAADPFVDPIRDDPRYRALLRQVGLAEYWPLGSPSPEP